MLNPFFYEITCDLSNLKTHVNRLPKEDKWEDIDDLPAINPSADEPVDIKYVETFQPIHPQDVKVVHIFITEGSCYDKAGFLSPPPDQIKYVLPPSSFEIIEYKFSNDVIEIINLVRLGAFPVADVACCSWANECPYPERIYQFLEFVIAYNGTVRFSDFSLRLAKPFLRKIDMPFTFRLDNNLNGKYKLRFDNQELLDTRLNDLCLLSRLAPSGTIDIYATRDTRRMIIDHLPPYAKILMTLETLSPCPCYVLLERPYKSGRVILFSCHFSEILNIHHLDRYVVADEITRIQGKTAADQFFADAKDLLETSVILISSSTSSPVINIV